MGNTKYGLQAYRSNPPISAFGRADTLYDAIGFKVGKVFFYSLG